MYMHGISHSGWGSGFQMSMMAAAAHGSAVLPVTLPVARISTRPSLSLNPFPKPDENVAFKLSRDAVQNERFTFEIDAENAIVGCTLGTLGPTVELFEE